MKENLVDAIGEEAYNFIQQYVDCEADDSLIVSTTNYFNIVNSKKSTSNIINISKINNVRYINKFLHIINEKLPIDGHYIGCVETFTARKNRKKINKIPFIRSIYFLFEFIFLRVFPKVYGLKKIYFFVTRGRNRLLSKAEILGRLVSSGFEIEEYDSFNNLLFFVVKKIKKPDTEITPSYGPLYRMPRMGKNGKIIGVYKFRTMHPYAEFLHDFILKRNGYSETGKPADDFRLTPWGKFFRRYWIDELPQLINLFIGDLKIVGVRPISKRYFQDIPEDIQKMRVKHKPGCIPPYVALNRKSSVEEVLEAERQYMIEKNKNPYFTDTKYFFKAIFNIVFKRKRSA